MTKEAKILLRRVYKILLSISIIASGLCLIAGCVSIHCSGNGYSSDVVVNTFSKINIPIYLCLALIIGDIIWELITPSNVKPKASNRKNMDNPSTQPSLNMTKLIVLGVAILSLIVGALLGGYADVLTKAVNICTECIGLG